MPQDGSRGAARFAIPGVYAALMPGRVRAEFEASGVLPDPRAVLGVDDPEKLLVWEWLKAEGAWRARQEVEARLHVMAAGRPYEMPGWWFGGRTLPAEPGWPVWLSSDMGVRTVRVYADDTVEPVDLKL